MADLKKPSRFWRIVLAVSLALNLGLIGFGVGGALSGRAGDGPPARYSIALGPIGQALSREDRRAIARELGGKIGKRTARNAQLREMVDLLRAEPFDPDALRTVLQNQTHNTLEVANAAQDAFVARIASMTIAERTLIADRIMSRRKR